MLLHVYQTKVYINTNELYGQNSDQAKVKAIDK